MAQELATRAGIDILTQETEVPEADLLTFIRDLRLMGEIAGRSGIKSDFPLVESQVINVERATEGLFKGQKSIAETVAPIYVGSRSVNFRHALLSRIIKPEDFGFFEIMPTEFRAAALRRQDDLQKEGMGAFDASQLYMALFIPELSVQLHIGTQLPEVRYVFSCLRHQNGSVAFKEYLDAGHYGFNKVGPHSRT